MIKGIIRLRAVALKELIQLRRDRLTFGMIIGLPMIQLLLFGYAINTDVRHIETLIVDEDSTAMSRDLARGLVATGTFDIVGVSPNRRDVEPMIRSGKVKAAFVLPPGLESSVLSGRSVKAQLIVDGSDPQVVSAAMASGAGFFGARSQKLLLDALPPGAGLPMLSMEAAPWYNPELRTAVNVIPGLTGLILTMTMVMFTSMALARERERGTMEQLIVSPVKRFELIVGKILPYVVIGYVQMSLILTVGHLVFRVPINGSLPLLYMVAFAFIAANLAMGMFISTLVKTQQQAMQGTFFIFLPNVLLSGFMFPFGGMPKPAQMIGNLLPLTHFLRLVRAIVLRGATFPDLVSELLALGVILAVLVTVATLRFRKTLD